MRKIWVIAQREYLATVKTKAFVIGIIMMPIMMGGGAGVSYVTKKFEDQGERKFAVIDRTPGARVFPVLETALERRNRDDIFDPKTGKRTSPLFALEKTEPSASTPDAVDAQRLDLSERVRKGQLAGFLEIGPKAMDEKLSFFSLVRNVAGLESAETKQERPDPATDPAAIRYQSKPTGAGSTEFYRWATIEIMLATRLGEKANDPAIRKQMQNQRVPVVMLGLLTRDPATGAVVDDEGATKTMVGFFVAFGCVMFMFMLVMVSAMPLMQGVIEEKMQRIAEVLLGCVRPFELMAGKLIGGVGIALTLFAIYFAGTLWGVHHFGVSDQIPASLMAWFIFYMVLALVMYGSIFVSIGAACSDLKEPQTLMGPVMLVIMLPIFALVPILREPDGIVARVSSFFPPTTPMIMVARQALSANIRWWEPVVGAIGVLLFTIFCVWAAGRIFRVGILMQGKPPRLGEMLRWVIQG